MKRTKNLQVRTKLSKKRQALRNQLDSAGFEADLLRERVFLSAEERQLAGERLKLLTETRERLQRELHGLTRGSRSQIAAGWQ